MMKKGIAILLLLTMLVPFVFTACGGGDGEATTPAATDPIVTPGETDPDTDPGTDPGTDAVTDPATDAVTDPPVIPDPETVLNAESLIKYSIVISDATPTTAVTALTNGIKNATGVTPKTVKDTADAVELEIIVGKTSRPESITAAEGLKYKDFKITFIGPKVIISAATDEMLEEAVEFAVSQFNDGEIRVPENFVYSNNYEYKCENVKIDGVSILDYTVVYAAEDEYSKLSAELFAREIGKLSGEFINIAPDTAEKKDREILVGTTNRGAAEAVNEYYAYKVTVNGKALTLCGYDKYAIANAGIGLIDAIAAANGNLSLDGLNVSYTLPDRTEYMADIEKLYMRWSAEWEPDPRMLDYELRKEALIKSTSRLLTNAHRAECDFYPENSIEAIISFYQMGGDVVELDIQVTKDGVIVLMHDDTLSRMTDWKLKRGTEVNGMLLPTSNNLADWTYAELQQLNLRESAGGDKAVVTPFKIPTLTEALKVCKNRLFVVPDKTDKWRYANVDGVLSDSPNYFLFDSMKEANNYESILLSYGLTSTTAIKLQKHIYEQTGVTAFILLRENGSSIAPYKVLNAQARPNSFGIQVHGQYADDYGKKYEYVFDNLKEKIVLAGWTIDNITDFLPYWKTMYNLGYRMIMTNDYLGLVKFAATTCEFE